MKRWLIVLLALVVCAAIAWTVWNSRKAPDELPIIPPVEVLRSGLELREDQLLYQHGAEQPFSGLLLENFSKNVRKMEIEIHEGKAHGYSRGWYENAQIEVDENFIHGVSNGRRTRWYSNGHKRSETNIIDGEIDGVYLEWHDNGIKASEMTLKKGVLDGLVQTWSSSGELKSQLEYAAGKIIKP